MASADIPCTLEPRGLCRGDGRRPDGISIIPWAQGRCLIWDATCHNTFAPTNIPFSCNGAGTVADRAAASKRILYSDLCQSHFFVPIAAESSGFNSNRNKQYEQNRHLIFFIILANALDKNQMIHNHT
jgi:hypothetical protein